ncbi:SRPBCC family protein [Actinoplanes sp. LDG1-06]|uniref:SRPBCC family protein n=1 Tax=Paractinoplanes ovalisporus TaxID=2810368 RepID=A0ABS2ANE0_9ACTN|nr:SRPBCC family protein [Actinoplanes ovalisporus]MBM2621320.1 SRPBCC family protein [Actinoplanes ovalisporus]
MTTDTAHVAERIDRPVNDVYAYVSNPAHLTTWAPGLGSSVEQVDGSWYVQSDVLGRVKVDFAPKNGFGVLDHVVTLETGEQVLNPVRVVPYGEGSEIVFSVRRPPGTSDEAFARDTGAVTADLARLKDILEKGN